jgi:hypothetical protein
MQKWLVKVRCPDRECLWLGSFEAEGRTEAKREARRFVSRHLPLDTTILAIARGRMQIKFDGPEEPFDENLN